MDSTVGKSQPSPDDHFMPWTLSEQGHWFVGVLSSLLLMAPLAFIPFSNTLPALSILLLSIGVLQQDGIFIALGYLFLVATSVYFAIIAFMGANALSMAVDMAFK